LTNFPSLSFSFPDRSQIQWRFVNRAIDEVENGSVPAVILVVRNSTDTAYFQRLRPYPRVMLRRTTAQFKDYNKSPPGFGIAVFCVAQHHKRSLFADFVAAFEPFGEPTIPFDIELLKSDSFYAQLERSKAFALKHYRDHWVQCNHCSKWRIIDFGAAAAIQENDEWHCSMLRPPTTSCGTPLTRFELAGGHYVARNGDFGLEKESEDFRGQVLWQQNAVGEKIGNEVKMNLGGGGEQGGNPAATTAAAQPTSPVIRENNTQTITTTVVVPDAAVLEAISVLPLGPLQAAVTSHGVVDSEVVTALELARLARIAANRAYLQHLASFNNVSTSISEQGGGIAATGAPPGSPPEALPGNHSAVLLAAREVSRIAALQTCASQKDAAWQMYEQARRKRQEEEAPLLAALEKVRQIENEARQRWEGAQHAAEEILNELNTTVAID
jgi:CW-type Zinc Finger